MFFKMLKSRIQNLLGLAPRSLGVVQFLPLGREVSFRHRVTVLELAQSSGVPVESSCGGMGTCGTCRVKVIAEGRGLPALSDLEREFRELGRLPPGERLSCQIWAQKGLIVSVPEIETAESKKGSS
jgi:ferredoxin